MRVEIFLLPILIFLVEILMSGISPPIMNSAFSSNMHYEQGPFSLTSGVWNGACILYTLGNIVRRYASSLLGSYIQLEYYVAAIQTCYSWELKSFYSSSSWSYSSMLQVALNKLQFIIKVS